MSLVVLFVVLVVIGLGMWWVAYKAPLTPFMKSLINFVLGLIAVLLVLSAFGILDQIMAVRTPRL